MTAAQIAKGLGHTKIRINYLYSELMASHIFEDCVLQEITIKTKDKDYIVSTYLDGIDFEDTTNHY